jgi:hypothetical protein
MLNRNSHLRHLTALVLFGLFASLFAFSQVSVLTRSYDNQRTGANTSEAVLTASNVNASQFGKLFQLQVDDQVYAGMLYVPGLTVNGATHNVIYVATVNNTVYAFDADSVGAPLWQRNFNNGGRPTMHTEVGSNCKPYLDFSGNIGIVGTPVIDASSNTMYFITRIVQGGSTVQTLRAIDIATGGDRASNAEKVIQASGFDPVVENQRVSLALSQGVLYLGWAAFCDTGPYHGWLMAYDTASLSQLGTFNTTPSGIEAGIWMSGFAPAFDASGNLYFSTGNGTFDGTNNFGESLLKLAPQTLSRLDFFTPSNWNTLNGGDTDFGSGGVILLPGTNVAVTGGKEGKIFALDISNLGGVATGDTQILQSFLAVDPTVVTNNSHHIHNGLVVWKSPQGINLYVSGEDDFVRAYRFNSSAQIFGTPSFATGSFVPSTQLFRTPSFATGTFLPPAGMPGSMMSLSANGSQSSTGILWSATPRLGNANQKVVPGVLTAYNAETLATLWNSGMTPGDDIFNFSKGSPPVVANGKVYVASFSNVVSVYGLTIPAPVSQNLALNKAATGSTSCNSGQTPDKAFNGSYSGGTTDEWCSLVKPSFLQVDLGANFAVNQFVVLHAGAGGEGGAANAHNEPHFDLNTSAYNIQVSTDGTNFTTVASTNNNIQSISTHNIAPAVARFVRLNITTPTRTTDTTSRIYELEVFGPPDASSAPDYLLSASPASLSIAQGASGNSTITAGSLNDFNSAVSLSASGLPSGVTASFNPTDTSTTSSLAFSAASTAATGTFPVIVTGVSGSLTHTATISLTITSAIPTPVQVNLSSVFNISTGIANDGQSFTGGGLDGRGFAYSGKLLGTTQSFSGVQFNLGPAAALDAVDNKVVPLPAGQFSSLKMLATGVNGRQSSQTLVVTYTDGTQSTFTQSFSDWGKPQNLSGESKAVTMAYRDRSNGGRDNHTFQLYGYSLAIDKNRTVSSITLPNNRNVVVLAITLAP